MPSSFYPTNTSTLHNQDRCILAAAWSFSNLFLHKKYDSTLHIKHLRLFIFCLQCTLHWDCTWASWLWNKVLHLKSKGGDAPPVLELSWCGIFSCQAIPFSRGRQAPHFLHSFFAAIWIGMFQRAVSSGGGGVLLFVPQWESSARWDSTPVIACVFCLWCQVMAIKALFKSRTKMTQSDKHKLSCASGS